MNQSMKRALLIVAFVAALGGPAIYSRMQAESSDTGEAGSRSDVPELLDRYGFMVKESAREAGINFQHVPPKIDQRLEHIGPQIAAMGASVSVVDFNRDGWSDVYVTNSGPRSKNSLYQNRGNGTFEDVATKVGLADLNQAGTGACMGSVWADIDNDGWEDVFIYKWGRPELFRNVDGVAFERITETAGLPEWSNTGCATWLDYDSDGLVDLMIAGYWPDNVRLESLEHTRIMPESFEYANNGGRKWLLKNLGDGKFEDVTERVGIESRRWSLALVASDFNSDGYPDLFLANDYGVSELFINEGGKAFREVGREAGIGYAPKSGMNAALGDVLNQGRLAIFETNISEEGVLLQGNNLWLPSGGAGEARFENFASAMGVEIGGWSFGAQFGDLNNDGFVDLYLTNGYFSGDQGTSYWYDFSQITGGNTRIISDASNWPDMRGRSLAGYQAKRLWLNDGYGQFKDVAQLVGAKDRFDGRGVAFADIDNQGSLDILVANQAGPLLLYRNRVIPDRNWIAFELEGTVSNRSAIGARVEVFWKGSRQLQELVAASGYAAQNQRRLHFGLGKADAIDRVEIVWPSGIRQILKGLEINRVHQVRESK